MNISIILIEGNADGKTVVVTDKTESVCVGGELYVVMQKEKFGLAMSVSKLTNNPGTFVIDKLLDHYAKTVGGSQMEVAKWHLKERVRKMKPGVTLFFPPVILFYIFFTFADNGFMLGIVASIYYLIGYRNGFVRLKEYIAKLG